MSFLPTDSMFQSHENCQPSSTSPDLLSSFAPHHQDFQGVSEFLMMRRSMSFTGAERSEEMRRRMEDDMSDDGSQVLGGGGGGGGEKKRRLNMEQVKALEKSFEEVGNKLEPERKMQLARALGLQPRQIAIWFQNRRARWKTKQLEKDYDLLKRQFDSLMSDNHALKSQNNHLQSQLLALKGRESTGTGPMIINLNKETEGSSWSNRSDNSADVNMEPTKTPSSDRPLYTTPPPPPPPQSHHHHHPTNRHCSFFVSSSASSSSLGPTPPPPPPPSFTQLLQHTTSSSRQTAPPPPPSTCHKIEQTAPADDHEVLCDMFRGIAEQPSFWPWPDHHQHYH